MYVLFVLLMFLFQFIKPPLLPGPPAVQRRARCLVCEGRGGGRLHSRCQGIKIPSMSSPHHSWVFLFLSYTVFACSVFSCLYM
uniref:Uncharacterized protein n=1 Tax=Pyxicephalus adspersus TaxID=30357 RepID=A0AAV3AG68_PYXAD|nr:TPA: hypothetical protein GDO54_013240 [Pyxicephalus adspersus]